VILWESLSPEPQEKCLNELWNDTNWFIWCKAKPKDMATQIFREYRKCNFVGRCAKPKQVGDNQAESQEASMLPGPEVGGSGGAKLEWLREK
jgi:hypothetical protein